MTRSTTFTGKKSASGIATKSLALGALGLVAFGVVAAAPAATAAPSTGGGISPMVEWSSDYATIFTNFTVDSYSPKGPGGEMLWNSIMSTSFDMAIPNDAAAGDTFKLTIPGDDFRFTNFTDLEITTPSGTVVAKASTLNSKNVVITLTDAVEVSQNLVGKATLTTQPIAETAVKEGTFTVNGADGANLGPNETYTINPVGKYGTNLGVLGKILPGNELGLRVSHNYAGKVADLSTVHTTIKANTEGAIPLCGGTDFPIQWMTEGNTVLVDSGLKAVIESCDPVTGEMVIGFPAGASMPAEADGYSIFTYWVADTPSKDYDFQWDSNINGQQLNRVGNGRSPVLDGAINGQVRPAKTVVTKTSDAPERLLVGDIVPYTITTTNVEAIRTALGISTADTLPAGTEFVSASDGGVYDAAAHTVTWPTVDYLAGQERAYTVEVKVLDASADLVTNKVTNTGINTCFEGDTTGSICEASVSDPLVRPGLEFDKKALPVVDLNKNGTVGDAGDGIPYEFVVKNMGNTAEPTIVFNDELLGIKDQVLDLPAPLEPGASYTLPGDYVYIITEGDVDAEKVVNTASVSVPGLPPVPDTVETPTTPVPPAPTPTTTPTATRVPAKPEAAKPVKDVSLATTSSDVDMAPLALTALGVVVAGGTVAAIAHKRGRKGSAAKNQG